MEEEEILGVNLDELSALFDNNSFLGGESFGWGLSPYKNIVMNDDGVMVKDESVVLYIDALGDANLSSKLWTYQKQDPLDAYIEPEFSKQNLFVKGLSKAIPGVPPFGVILVPWFNVETYEQFGATSIKFPQDTPAGFVPCNGFTIEIDGRRFKLPQLISRISTDLEENETTEYIPPPGMAYMMRLPDGLSTDDIFVVSGGDMTKPLRNFGNPASPFNDYKSFLYS